jgi:sulfite exporter TauE/SafE
MHHFFQDPDLGAILAGLCGSADPMAVYGVTLTLLAAGFVGGFAHCGPMCGPFVLMQLGDGEGGSVIVGRATPGLLPAYHLGRLTTYVALGAAAGGLGSAFTRMTEFHWLVSALLVLAAASFLLQAVKGATQFLPFSLSTSFGSGLGNLIARAARPFLSGNRRSARGGRGYVLGILLGFLPCGFLYAAIIAAAATGGAGAGGVAMAAFGLGTVPALAAIGLAGAGMARRWHRIAAAAMPAIFLFNAVTLGGIALHMAG